MLPHTQAKIPSSYYDSLPRGYDYACILHGHYGQRFWHEYRYQKMIELAALKEGHTVLDVGCGAGVLLSLLPEGVKKIGMDIAPSQLEFAKEKWNASVFCADAENIPLASDSVDSVFLGELLEHISIDAGKKTLQEIRRVLKPEGSLIISTPNYEGIWPLWEGIGNHFGKIDFRHVHITHYTPARLRSTLLECGLGVDSVQPGLFLSPLLEAVPSLAQKMAEVDHRLFGRWGAILFAKATKVSNSSIKS